MVVAAALGTRTTIVVVAAEVALGTSRSRRAVVEMGTTTQDLTREVAAAMAMATAMAMVGTQLEKS